MNVSKIIKIRLSSANTDLTLTSQNSTVFCTFDNLSNDQQKQVSKNIGGVYKIENKYRLPACDRTKVYDKPGSYMIYNVALENDDDNLSYGIYANVLLVESCFKNYLVNVSNINLII